MKWRINKTTFGIAMQELSACPTDGTYQVEIKRYKKNRSLAQNNLMWMWLSLISKHYHETHGDLKAPAIFHEYLKELFLGKHTVQVFNKAITVTKSTTDLNTKEFTDYLEQMDIWAMQEINLQLPHPEIMWLEAMGKAA